MKGFILFIICFIVLVLASYAQTPGLIIKPATPPGKAVLDPNGDGYASFTNSGYIDNDYEHDETELPMVTVIRPDPPNDPVKGPSGSFNDIVGTSEDGENAVFTYIDGNNNLIFRFRLDGYAPNSKTYSMLIDTDQKFGFTGPDADPNAVVGNPGFEIEVALRTNFGVFVYNINGTATLPSPSASYTGETNYQQSIALTTNSSSPDYFYDFYVPLSALPGVTASTPLRYAALTTMNPNGGLGSNAASDIGGTSEGTNLDNVFENLLNDQTPAVPGAEVLVRSACPGISAPINSGATSVSGTSSEANGTVIEVFRNDVSIGTTTVTGSAWTLGSVGPFISGDVLKATATASGKGVSLSSCNLIFVGSSCTEIPGIQTIDNGNKGVTILNVADYPVGTVITVRNAADNSEWVGNKADNNPYTITQTDINNGTVNIGCDGQGNCMNDGIYYVVATAPSTCPSPKAYFNVGACANTINAPAIDVTAPNSNMVTGTLGVSGATLFLYANGILIGEKLLTASGAWFIYVNPTEICNVTLTAKQIASGYCLSDPSAGRVVGQGVSTAPVVDVDLCASSISTISGYSVEPDGTTIQVYVAASLVGTTTVSGGLWSVSASASTGQAITATATNSNGCETVSPASAAVSLTGTTTLTGNFTLGATIYNTTNPVPVNYSGLTPSTSYTINLQIDGYTIGSTTFTSSGSGSGSVNISPTNAGDLYIGGALGISLKQGTQCESSTYDLAATVQCQVPDFTSSVISVTEEDQCVTLSGEFTLTNSETLVIYTPVDIGGNTTGYSTLGTGGTITLYTYPFATAGTETFYVKAQRITASVACETQSDDFVTFNAFGPPEITTQPTNQDLCYGNPTSITVEWTGEGPYNVQWQYNSGSGFTNLSNTGVYSQTSLSNTSATISTLLISDVSLLDNYAFRCIITDLGVPAECNDTISNVSTFTVEYVYLSASSVTNATTGNNGAISITAAGGDAPYSYDWHHINGSGTFGEIEDLTGLSEGTYTVTVKDANDCTWEESFVVLGPGSIDLAEVSTTQISCYGANDGAFEVVATLGTGPYIYSIDNFATSQSSGVFEDLLPGSYTVRARDALNANSNSVNIVITEPAEIVITATPSNPSVALNDGSINISLTGGVAPFDYELYTGTYPSGSLLTSSTNNNNSTHQFTGLSENTYYVVITDDNGCESVRTGITLSEPNIATESCAYVAAHSFNSPQDNYSGYDGTYNFFSGAWAEGTDNQNKIKVFGAALTFGNTNLNNLTLSGTSDISRSIDLTGASFDNTTPTVSFDFSLTRGPNNNKDDFGIRLYVNNAASPAYNLAIAAAAVTPGSVTLNELSANVDFINGTNTFRFEIYDVAGGKYEANSYFNIGNFSISFSKEIIASSVSLPSTCNNGSINLDVSGGFSPYTYDWDTDASNDFDDPQDLSGLSAGTYGVIIRDSRGCETVEITETVASAPLSASVTGSNPTCAGGGSNGTITATVNDLGGGGPFLYKLIKGTSDTIQTAISALASKTFTGLNSGTYKVRVWDVNNCTVLTGTYELSLPALSSVFSAVSSTTMCAGGSVDVKIDITGGTSPYIVVLSNGQSFTNYTSGSTVQVSPSVSTTLTVTSVTDDISCVSGSNANSVAITVIPAPVAPTSAQSDRDEFCADDAGNITLTATGGSGTTLEWYTESCGGTSIGSGTPLVIASPTVTTTYYARYENSCGGSACASVTVTVNPLPANPPISGGNETICQGDVNPALEASTGGAVTDWYTAASGGTLLLSNSDNYTPSVTNAGSYTYYAESRDPVTGCVNGTRTPVSLTINPAPTPGLTSSDANNSICAGEEVTFTATGGYQYEFFKNAVSVLGPTFNDTYTTSALANGDAVTVVAISNQGCTATSSAIVTTVNAVPVITNPGPQSSCGDYTLPIINGTGLTGNEAYYTATGGGGTEYDAGDEITASTTLYIYDSNNGCTDEESFTITINRFNLVVSPSGAVDCPELSFSTSPAFNPENSSYNPGATEITFRVEPDGNYSYSLNWTFEFDLSGLVVVPNTTSTITMLTLSGDDTTPPSQTSGDELSGTIDAGDNTYVDLSFQVINTPGSEQSIDFTISNGFDGNACGETETIDDNDATYTLEAMPEVGSFN